MRTQVSRIPASPVTSGRSGLLTRSTSRSVIWFRTFEAAFRNDAQSEPRAIAPTTAQVTPLRRVGVVDAPERADGPRDDAEERREEREGAGEADGGARRHEDVGRGYTEVL